MKQERFAFARLKSDLILPVLYAMRYFLTLMSFSAPFYPVIYYIIFEHPSSLNIRARSPTHEGITTGGAREPLFRQIPTILDTPWLRRILNQVMWCQPS